MNSTTERDEDIRDFIRSSVNQFYESKGTGLLLSSLGLELRKEFADFDEYLNGRKLADFVRESLADTVLLEGSPTNKKLLSAFPSKVGEKEVEAAFLKARSKSTGGAIPRFHPAIWLAFTKPLASGLSRVVSLNPVVFEDILTRNVPSGSLVIDQSDIIPPSVKLSSHDFPGDVSKSILAWAAKNDITPDEVTAQDKNLSRREDKRTLMSALLGALSESQRKRVALPLDVVATLQEKSLS